MAKKSIKKLWKEKAQGKYHIGCIFPNDTPYGDYGDKKCYLSKVKKNGEYEFVTDHTYAKDFSEQKADEILKKLKDEFGGKITNESLERKLNESVGRKLFWSNTQNYEYWRDKASDEEVLEEFCNLQDIDESEVDEDYAEYDEDGNIVSYDYDAMRDYICDDDMIYEQEWEDLKYNILPEVEKQLFNDWLIIDGEVIGRDNGQRNDYDRWFYPIVEKIQDYYGNAEIYLDEDDNLEGWYTLPSTEAGFYRLARNIPDVVDYVKNELEYRSEYDEGDDYEGWYEGLNGKDLWLAALEDIDLSDIDFDGLEEWLVPIKKPW